MEKHNYFMSLSLVTEMTVLTDSGKEINVNLETEDTAGFIRVFKTEEEAKKHGDYMPITWLEEKEQ